MRITHTKCHRSLRGRHTDFGTEFDHLKAGVGAAAGPCSLTASRKVIGFGVEGGIVLATVAALRGGMGEDLQTRYDFLEVGSVSGFLFPAVGHQLRILFRHVGVLGDWRARFVPHHRHGHSCRGYAIIRILTSCYLPQNDSIAKEEIIFCNVKNCVSKKLWNK